MLPANYVAQMIEINGKLDTPFFFVVGPRVKTDLKRGLSYTPTSPSK